MDKVNQAVKLRIQQEAIRAKLEKLIASMNGAEFNEYSKRIKK